MEAQNGTNRQAFRRRFPFLPAFSAAPSHPVGIGGTKKRKMGGDAPNAVRKALSASQAGRTAMPVATAPAPRHQPPMGKAPLTGRTCRDRVCAENGGRPRGARNDPVRLWPTASPLWAAVSPPLGKGRQHCLPAKRQPHRALALQKGGVFPLPGRGAPPPHARRAQRKAGGSRVAPLPPFARLCQGRPDRSPGRGRVTKS